MKKMPKMDEEWLKARDSIMRLSNLTEEEANEVVDLLVNPDRTEDFTTGLESVFKKLKDENGTI